MINTKAESIYKKSWARGTQTSFFETFTIAEVDLF